MGVFVLGRMLLGAGSGTSSIAASTWVFNCSTLECGLTVPQVARRNTAFEIPRRRLEFHLHHILCWLILLAFPSRPAITLTYLGALIAAGVTYATADIPDSWSWRMPVALQALFSFLCLACLFFVPESPRWLFHRGRLEDALTSLASTHSDGNEADPETLRQHQEIIDTLQYEREAGQKMTYAEIFRAPISRRRLFLVVSVAVLAMSSGEFDLELCLEWSIADVGRKQHRFVLPG